MRGPRYSIIPCQAVYDKRFKLAHYRILGCLGHHTDANGWCKLKQKTMAEELGYARETLNRTIRELEGWGYVEKTDNRAISNGYHACSSYRVLMDRAGLPSDVGDHEGSDVADHEAGDVSDHIINDPSLQRPKEDNPLTPKGGRAQGKARKGKAQPSLTASLEASSAQADRQEDTSKLLGAATIEAIIKRNNNRTKSGAWDESFAVFADGYKAICVKAGKSGAVMGKDKGEKAWRKLTDGERAERTAALPAYADKLSREEYLHPQHISTFVNSGWRDFAAEPVDETARAAELEAKQVRDVAFDLVTDQPKRIKVYGWATFEDVKRKASKIWNAAIEHARREYDWQPSTLAAAA